jgi:ankyrin repeat protein
MTALMWAAEKGHTLAVKALLEGGADARQVDKVRKRESRAMSSKWCRELRCPLILILN